MISQTYQVKNKLNETVYIANWLAEAIDHASQQGFDRIISGRNEIWVCVNGSWKIEGKEISERLSKWLNQQMSLDRKD